MENISIIIAAFNEEESLPILLEQTLSFLQYFSPHGEIIIINDGSQDRTGNIAEEWAKKISLIRVFHLSKNSGMGAALLEGFSKAEKEWVTMLPADGQIHPFELKKMLPFMGSSDVITTLYDNRRYSLGRRILSLSFRLISVLITGIRAQNDGTYLIRREVLKRLRPQCKSFLLNLEIPVLAKSLGFRVSSAWISVSPRIAGFSKALSLKRVLHVLREEMGLGLRVYENRFTKWKETLGKK